MMEPMWDYWCPHEHQRVLYENELHVGIVSVDDEGVAHPLFVAAIVPPFPTEPRPSQAEVIAREIRDALAVKDWGDFPAWVRAHGGGGFSWPTLFEDAVTVTEKTE